MTIVRIVLGVVIGVAVGFGLVMVGDALNHRLFPPPADLQVTDREALGRYMATAPIISLLGLPVTWMVAAFAGAFAGAKIGARAWTGWIAGGALIAATCLNLALIPHPLWMLVAAIVFAPLAAWFGAKLGAPAPRT